MAEQRCAPSEQREQDSGSIPDISISSKKKGGEKDGRIYIHKADGIRSRGYR